MWWLSSCVPCGWTHSSSLFAFEKERPRPVVLMLLPLGGAGIEVIAQRAQLLIRCRKSDGSRGSEKSGKMQGIRQMRACDQGGRFDVEAEKLGNWCA